MSITKLHDVAVYIFKQYPSGTRFSRARFVKLIYLSDWKHVLINGNQITDTVWYFHNYGPYVPEIVDQLANDLDFEVKNGSNFLGEPNISIGLLNPGAVFNLSESEQEATRIVIEATRYLPWEQFISSVYSTYPIRVSARHSNLDLVELAKEYAPIRKKLQAQSAAG